ncbi:ABC transporter permease [Psychrobacillus soli]|uniref:Iron ABC transporter permease n=1 Tax=Psychrobacillus soli TaxID=1543965 RepID=A0A544T4C3_9BACI|nr:iron ABC transporter permease [Psychrobacillus soli]TQR12297.1 iron ABC transporter permease [Psychrobacillus soli]
MTQVVTPETITKKGFSMKMMKRLIGLTSLLLIILLFLLPIVRLFVMSFKHNDQFSLINYTIILAEASTWSMLQNTLIVVVGSTLFALLLGVGTAWVMAYTDIRWKKVIQIFIIIPFVIPSYIVTIAWSQFANSIDVIDIHLNSHLGIIFVLGISHYPLVYLFTVTVLKRIPKELEWAVRSSGGSSWVAFKRVTIPLALPGIVGGGMIVFLSNLDNFGIPAILGIPANITVLSTAIYQEVIGFGPNAFARAATLSVLLALVAFVGTGLQWFLLRKSKLSETASIDESPRYILGKRRKWLEIPLWIFLLGISIVPLLSMVKTSLIRAYGLDFIRENITLKHYQYVLFEYDKVLQSMGTSLKLALITTFICAVFGTMIAYIRSRKNSSIMRFVEVIVGLPYALPGMVMALSMIFAWMQPIPGWNPGLYGTAWILLIAYITRFMILQVRGSMTAISQVSIDLEEAAHLFGASTFVKWKTILLPLLLSGIVSGAFLVLLTTLTELTVSSLLWSSGTETIGIVIYNFEQAGYTTHSSALSVVILGLMLLLALIVYGIQYWWKRRLSKG